MKPKQCRDAYQPWQRTKRMTSHHALCLVDISIANNFFSQHVFEDGLKIPSLVLCFVFCELMGVSPSAKTFQFDSGLRCGRHLQLLWIWLPNECNPQSQPWQYVHFAIAFGTRTFRDSSESRGTAGSARCRPAVVQRWCTCKPWRHTGHAFMSTQTIQK